MTFERKIALANAISEWIDSQPVAKVAAIGDPLFDQVCSEIEVEAEIENFQLSDHVVIPGGPRSVTGHKQCDCCSQYKADVELIWCDSVGETYACPTCRGWDDTDRAYEEARDRKIEDRLDGRVEPNED